MARRINKNSLLYKNRFTFLSLIIVLGMTLIAQFAFDINRQIQSHNNADIPIGGPFILRTHTGQEFTQENLLGKQTLLFFGFTHCPDICPTSLTTMSEIYDLLPTEKRQHLQTIFVTVDPLRDTQHVLSEYVAAFHPSIIGLTGTVEQSKTIQKAYLVYAAFDKPDTEGLYNVNHSGYIYLMDSHGNYQAHFGHATPAQEIIKHL